MSVKDFKFVSPGVFINEIDNSFIPKSAEAIGPVVIGRAKRGLGLQPVKVQSYSEFVEVFGDTVPGGAGGDVYRNGNELQAPMYGTYAAKAFLNANVAPLTYVRLLGTQSPEQDGSTAAKAGWKTDNQMGDSKGGTFGLWIAESGSAAPTGSTTPMSFQLAAIWYNDDGGVELSGTVWGPGNDTFGGTGAKTVGTKPNDGTTGTSQGTCTLITSDATGNFTAVISGSTSASEKVTFNFSDDSENFIRKVFNTNPQLRTAGSFYPTSAEKDWWLGETFEQEVQDDSLVGKPLVGLIVGIQLDTTNDYGPGMMLGSSTREAVAGWFIGQDSKTYSDYVPESAQKLFRLHGRGHGEWLHKNCKVSIERIRQSNSTVSDYGTFSVVIRSLKDTDNNVQVMERFDNLDLNPASPNYIAKQIGTEYYTWNESERRLTTPPSSYPNKSKFIRVEMDESVDNGASGMEIFLPFGYYGPPKFTNVNLACMPMPAGTDTAGYIQQDSFYIVTGSSVPGHHVGTSGLAALAGQFLSGGVPNLTASCAFPVARLRNSSSDGGLTKFTDAYFGLQTTRTSGSSVTDQSIADIHRWWSTAIAADPVSSIATGTDGWAYVFTLDNVVSASSTSYYYRSGSRVDGSSATAITGANTYKDLLDAGVNKFTAPFWGGFDGLNIRVPDPVYNKGMSSAATNTNNSIYYTWRRAIDTIADPEFVDMNMLSAPGLGTPALTTHMINVCEDRADALALIDLEDAYKPTHEVRVSTLADRVTYTPTQLANNLKTRRIDSSYGATFYPWVQTRDANTGQLLWVPPTVAMMGVLASSERKSKIWFAPAGFNRGGLSDGAAGIPITNVTTRLTSDNRDELYLARINPIASFPSTGIVVFGQKTLQERQSALDRINVRRMVIYLKKQISILSTQVLFEQNVQATWNRFKGLIEPFLSNVKTEFGITDYRLILDESTTTADLIDQNVLYAKIMVKPARAIEFIAIDFVIASTGASFDD